MAGAATDSTPAGVARFITERRERVAEFRLIKEAAEELGVRVWLFGGTAAGFAHYARWDLEREAGDPRYQAGFFDYDFTNIYRSTQDADLVVDSTPAQAAELESLIKRKMSFLQGSKEHWEVRLLRQDRTSPSGQVKQALLANPDFLEQNTDSNSTGMIELTDPPPGESVVRDLRDWESRQPFFLQDVTEGRLHYYWSATHRQTSRYQAGDNPELFSVIRYLVKAFQYDLTVEGEDLARVRAVIDAFDLEREHPQLSQWAKGWLERYGPNLVRHAVNIEYAWNTLEKLGLRQKLISLSEPSTVGSLGWWLSREPLRTSQVGQGEGRSAAELGIEVVAHETRDFLAYESITRDTTLRPNVLISRPDHPGESAAAGPGFYTRPGRIGARGTGLTIRFTVNPGAREGTDFTLHGDLVLFTNRAALQVIPESLQATLPEYFAMLQSGAIDWNDRGAWMKLKRRLSLRGLTAEDESELVAIVGEEIDRLDRVGEASGEHPSPLLEEWFALPVSRRHPEVVEKLAGAVANEIDRLLGWRRDRPPRFSDRGWHLLLLERWLALPVGSTHPELVERLREGLSLAIERYYPDAFESRKAIQPLAEAWFPLRAAKDDLELLERLLDRHALSELRANRVGFPSWPHTMNVILHLGGWARNPGFARVLLDRGMEEWLMLLLATQPYEWSARPEVVLELSGRVAEARLDEILRSPYWKAESRLRALCGGADPTVACLRDGLRRESAAREITRDLAGISAPPSGCP